MPTRSCCAIWVRGQTSTRRRAGKPTAAVAIKLTYKMKKGNAKIKITKAGKITVAKGLKKGKTYKVKIKVASAQTATFKSAHTTVALKVKV